MNIYLVSGDWGQNIGNAFFNVGGKHVLETAFPNANVQYIQDQPGYWTFNRNRVNPENSWDLLAKLEVDLLVLQGPLFSLAFEKLWAETIEKLYKRGVKVAYLSTAFFQHKEEEVEIVRRLFDKYPPAFVTTRDRETYTRLSEFVDCIYDGICTAWFVPDEYKSCSLDTAPYVCVNFDRWPEPRFKEFSTLDNSKEKSNLSIEINSKHYEIQQPKLQMALSNRGKGKAYIGAAIDFRKLPSKLGKYEIVRTEHRTNPYMGWKIFKHPNSVAHDEPFTYFTVYANSKLTISDRVHACVATLAYGNAAMLFTNSPRSRLFDRLGLEDIRKRPVTLDLEHLEIEKKELIHWLKNCL